MGEVNQSAEKVKLAADIKAQLINCVGYQGDELQKSRDDAYNYYFQRPRGDEVEGRSTFVTGDLSSMVEGNLAQMTAPLADMRIAEYCAYSAEDEEQSQVESDCVHELIFNRQNGFIEVTAAIKDAMLIRNAVIKIWIDERTYKKTINKENVDPAVMYELLEQIRQQQSAKGVEVLGDVHKYDTRNKKFSATITKKSKKFKVQALAPENLLVPKTWDRHDFEGCPFLAERHVEPRSTLVERGHDKKLVDAIPRYNNNVNALTQQSRLPNGLSQNTNPIDKTQDQVEWFECYVAMDEGDGTAELRRVDIAGNIILEDTPADMISYAPGAIFINPHSYIAISLFDKLKSSQDSGTALTRALFDNLNTTSKNRVAYLDGIVEETDVTDGRTNGGIRVKPGVGIQDVRQAITAFSIPDTSANILSNLEHQRRVRSEMGGATLDMATGQMQLSDRVGSQGLDRAYSVMEMLASFMTKTIANTLIRNMYLIAHETLRTQWMGPITFKRGNQWIIQDPSKWQMREAVKVNLGASLGERARQSAVLEKVMLKQEALAQNGMEGILVDVQGYWKAFLAWMRVNDLPNPEQFVLDPRSPQSQKAFQDKTVKTQQQQQKQDGLMQQAVGLEQIRVGLDKYKTDAELQFKYWDASIGAQIEEAKLAVQGVIDLVKAKETAKKAEENGTSDDKSGKTGSGAEPSGKQVVAGNTD